MIENLFRGFPEFWGGGVAHSIMILSLVITIGLYLSKLRVKNISLGLAWILFVGLLFSNLRFNLDEHLLHFLKEFGLVLFVYSIGLEVGPAFFSSFSKVSKKLNGLATIVVMLGIATVLCIFSLSGISITAITGLLSGAVTNTPSLGTAQQAYSDLRQIDAPTIAEAYAVAYPMGILGVILSFGLLRWLFGMNKKGKVAEEKKAVTGLTPVDNVTLNTFYIRVNNEMIEGSNVNHIGELLKRDFIISRISRNQDTVSEEVVSGSTVVHQGDLLVVVAHPGDMDAICALLGDRVEADNNRFSNKLISKRITISRTAVNGKSIAQLKIRSVYGVNITRVNRSGMELVAVPAFQLQMGDTVTVVGSELAIHHVEKLLSSSSKLLYTPNLIPIFLGIVLGCILANVPFLLPGISETLRLGLTGGPFIVAILIGYLGPKINLVTYNTMSANLMLRQLGLCIFLACVGLGTGVDFVRDVFSEQGLSWLLYGTLITVIPVLLGGVIGRYVFRIDYFTLLGVLAGSNTNPAALAYVNDMTENHAPAVGYSMVYPYVMFLRIVTIQILIFVFG